MQTKLISKANRSMAFCPSKGGYVDILLIGSFKSALTISTKDAILYPMIDVPQTWKTAVAVNLTLNLKPLKTAIQLP